MLLPLLPGVLRSRPITKGPLLNTGIHSRMSGPVHLGVGVFARLRGPMARWILAPTVVEAVGNKPKRIEEFVGRVNSGHAALSVARMASPGGWQEPGQRPEFAEVTLVLRGMLRVEHADGVLEVRAGQAVVAEAGEWVRYSTPEAEGAEYVAICLPAFSPATVHRDGTPSGGGPR